MKGRTFEEYMENYIRKILQQPLLEEEEKCRIRDREYQRREYIARRLGWRTPKDDANMMCYIARGGLIRPRRLFLTRIKI